MANVAKRLANTTFDWTNNQANPLLAEEDQRFQDQAGAGNFHGNEASAAYEDDLNNGYNYGEQAGITGLRTGDQGGSNVPGLEELSSVSPDEAKANFLTQQEQQGITGDPRAVANTESAALNKATGNGYSSKLDAITGSQALGIDPNFDSQYEMTPEQQNDIVNSASRDVSQVSEGNWEDAVRRNNAAGVGPLGMGALRARMTRGASSDAAAAATKARIAASQEAANRIQQAEQMRLGAAQNQAGLQTGATEDVAAKQLQAATTGGAAQSEAEKEASDRAAAIGTNRQTTQETNSGNNYTRGVTANNALSSRYGTVGNTRLGQQNTGAAGLAGIQQTESGNANTALGLKNQTIGTAGGVENGAAGVVTGAQTQPGIGSKILGAGLGALAAFEDGGIATEPTLANLGESGPEAVIPLSGAGGSPDSRPIGGTDAQPNDPFEQEARKPVDIGNFRSKMQQIGNVAGGIQNGMQGRPFQSRYGAPPSVDPSQQPQVRPGDDSQFGGDGSPAPASPAPWRSALNKVGQVAGGIQRGMSPATTGTRPMQQQPGQFYGGGSIVNRPTRAIIGEDGPEAVVPLHPRAGSRMRPSAVFGKRYGAA